MTRHILIRANNDGTRVSWLTPAGLRELLADPAAYAGITQFCDPAQLDNPDPNYWPDGAGVLLRADVVIPVPSSAYRLPDDDEAAVAAVTRWAMGSSSTIKMGDVL